VVKLGRVGVWLAAYVAACAAFGRVKNGSLLVAVLVIFAVVGAALKLHDVARHELATGGLSLKKRVQWSLLFLVAGAIPLALGATGVLEGGTFFGIAILYLGLGVLVEQLRDDRAFPSKWGYRFLGISSVVALIGVAIVAVSGSSAGLGVAAAGILTAPIGLSLLSEATIRRLRDGGRPQDWVLAVLGASLFLAGLLTIWGLGVGAEFVPAIGAIVFVLVAAIASRSNADIVLVIAMAAVVWVLSQRALPIPESVTAERGETVVAALGDSYMSGEGADQFYEGTNTKGVNGCRRSPTAYPALLMLEDDPNIPKDVAFLACSGAVIEGVHNQLESLERLREDEDVSVAFTLLDGGGNDALFGSVGRTCLLPGDCSELGPAWTANLQKVEASLDELYADVRTAMEGTRVFVIPYPVPIRELGCEGSPFTDKEHQFLHDFTVKLDEAVQRAATRAEFEYVETMATALAGSRVCDGPAGEVGVNFFAANSVGGTLEQSVNPVNWFHNSLHPNSRGHELMRAAFVQWLDDHPDPAPAAADLDATLAPSATGEECEGQFAEDLTACGDRWVLRSSGRLLLTKGLVGLLLPIGAWLLAVPMIRRWRMFFGAEETE
jgi:hypothetical protein